jgi:hypothetical protein
MVALILGLNPDMVIQFTKISVNGPRMGRSDCGSNIGSNSDKVDNDKKTTVVQYQIPKNSALLYRLSGDFNPIHVEGKLGLKDALCSSNEGQTQSHVNGRGPVLHGLCTLGYSLSSSSQSKARAK